MMALTRRRAACGQQTRRQEGESKLIFKRSKSSGGDKGIGS